MYIVLEGNLNEGFRFYGPFHSFDDASEWADQETEGLTWITEIEKPLRSY